MKLLFLTIAPTLLLAQSIVDLAVATPSLSMLTEILTTPVYKPVLDALSGAGPFTVFAPTDAAFAAAGVDPSNVAAVTNVLQYHVLSGKVASTALAASQTPTMLNGDRAIVTKSASGVTIAGAKVVLADVEATNGIVHVIDKVILPPSQSIVDIAVATPAVSSLVSLLTKPAYKPVLDALSGKGPFTVFAPTDAAFAAAGVDTSDVKAVTAVLKYHVLSGAVYSDDLKASQIVPTLNGDKITVKKGPGGVTVNTATVVIANVAGTNGVIHVIDKVLLPPTPVKAVSAGTMGLSSAPMMGTTMSIGGYARAPMTSTYNPVPAYSTAPAINRGWGASALPYNSFGSSFGSYSPWTNAYGAYGTYGGYGGSYGYGAAVSAPAAPLYSTPPVTTAAYSPYTSSYGGWGGISTPYQGLGFGGNWGGYGGIYGGNWGNIWGGYGNVGGYGYSG